MNYPKKIDLHIHTCVSDGTDEPCEIIERVKEAKIDLFAITDHDALKACQEIQSYFVPGDPLFLYGVEFSCKDEEGQYHILGYDYDPTAPSINAVVDKGHALRKKKLEERLMLLEEKFGFTFQEKDISALRSLDNPGKPHIGNLMVSYGYAKTKEEAILKYINHCRAKTIHIRPEEAIRAILDAGGIPILAHPVYGRGDELILGDDLDHRLRRLVEFGLQGVEGFYSGFTAKLQKEALSLAEHYHLYVTAGSDYHGKNKMICLGDTNLSDPTMYPQGLQRFLDTVLEK